MSKAPERIFLQWPEDGEPPPYSTEGVTWCEDQIEETDVEYVRVEYARRTSNEEIVSGQELSVKDFITDDQITELWMDSALCKDRHIGFGLMIAGEVMAQLRARGLVKNASERTVSGTGKSRER